MAGIRIAVGDDTIADFIVDNYGPQAGTSTEENFLCCRPHRYRLFFNLEAFVRKVLMSLTNGSSAGLDILEAWRSSHHCGPAGKKFLEIFV